MNLFMEYFKLIDLLQPTEAHVLSLKRVRDLRRRVRDETDQTNQGQVSEKDQSQVSETNPSQGEANQGQV